LKTRIKRLNKDELAAYHAAVRLLSMREYCRVELTARLHNKGFEGELIAVVCRQLIQDGYLSESRYAEAFLRGRMSRGETPRVAAIKARQKGVDESALQDALADAEAGFDADQACRTMLQRRDPQGLRHDEQRVWQKHARFLQNKGFDAATIVHILNEFNDRPD